MNEPIQVKIGIIGENESDKTSILLKYISPNMQKGYIPSSDEDFSKIIHVDDFPVNVTLIDVIDTDEFPEMRYSYYQQVQGFIFVFDISKPISLQYLKHIYDDIRASIDEDITCVVVANNSQYRIQNLPDLISIENYPHIEREFNCKVFETSASTNQNINELYEYLVRKLLLSVHRQPIFRTYSDPLIPIKEPLNKDSPLIVKKISIGKDSEKRFQKKILKSLDHNVLINQLKFSVQQKCIQINAAHSNIKSLEKQLETKTTELNQANEKITQLEESAKSAANELHSSKATIAELDEKCKLQTEQIGSLQDKVGLLEESCKSKESSLDELQRKYSELEQRLRMKEKQLEEFRLKCSTLDEFGQISEKNSNENEIKIDQEQDHLINDKDGKDHSEDREQPQTRSSEGLIDKDILKDKEQAQVKSSEDQIDQEKVQPVNEIVKIQALNCEEARNKDDAEEIKIEEEEEDKENEFGQTLQSKSAELEDAEQKCQKLEQIIIESQKSLINRSNINEEKFQMTKNILSRVQENDANS
ncbi:hypothetical protein M9Y10_000610 [Tritrichomonas musculus]|uniref:Ras family protein n=1 Tax=Tritrichomonas musculus TaxID=1915356 RepID=A0ABR2L5N7_9EUKA